MLTNQAEHDSQAVPTERINRFLFGRTPRDGSACGPVILAGPTCDSADILYRRHPYDLPLDLEIGDSIDFLSAGAYTASVATVAFNGFTPIKSYFVR